MQQLKSSQISLPAVLLVDDKPSNLLSLQAVLDELGTPLLTANSGEEALTTLLLHDIALVLLDVQMPDMDGYEVARLMRSNPRTRKIPVIFITANALDERSAMLGYEVGAMDYIYKPVSGNILRSKVRVVLELEASRKALVRANQELTASRSYYSTILSTAAEGILVVNPEGVIDYANPAASMMLSEAAELVGTPLPQLLTPPGENLVPWNASAYYAKWHQGLTYRQMDTTLYTLDHRSIPVSLSCSPLPIPLTGMVIVFQDISLAKELQLRLEQQAVTDSLTGLLNRHGFMQALANTIARHERRREKSLALLYLDLDGFKVVNDSLGHEAGDQLLEVFAQRLRKCLRPYDLIARLGGDEFAVLVDSIESNVDSERIAQKILRTLQHPIEVFGHQVNVGASIGIAEYHEVGKSPEALLQAADMAMYQAKRTERNTYRFFTQEMNFQARARRLLEESLRNSIASHRFKLHYQPQINLADGSLRGHEALVRWEHEAAGTIMPSTFIPLLEETGLIHQLGPWIIREACKQNLAMQNAAIDKKIIAINISAHQFTQRDLVEDIRIILQETELNPELIELELTEGTLMKDVSNTKKQLWGLKNLGLKLAIDDFGTGYSSLAYLKQFPIDVLKIDRSFVVHCHHAKRDQAIIDTILQLGRNLGLSVIAEGVETRAQADWLKQHGCSIAQGYLFGKPSPATP